VAFAPFLVAFSESNELVRMLAIACTCFIAALQAVSGYSDFKKNWIAYKNTVNELEIMKLKFENYKNCEDERAKPELENLFNDFTELMRAHDKLWASNVKDNRSKA